MEISLYAQLKRRFPMDTVDITEERILIVSGTFIGWAPKERESHLLSDVPSLKDKRLVLLTPAEVKDQALGNPVANSMPPAEKSFLAGKIEQVQDEVRTADLHGSPLDTASLFQKVFTLLRFHEAALAVSVRDFRVLQEEVKQLREALAHKKDLFS